MPYSSRDDLPDSVKDNLPAHAQDIYKEAFNSAYDEHKSESDGEETAHKIAWAAVKHSYEKSEDGTWRKK
ncbi:MAG TPA: ChaB family protein [Patescibacteria group bacterium]|nr:ChaB family protein [Patescibacteria group bacterium]